MSEAPGGERLSLVIPTLRRQAVLAETLRSLDACDPLPAELIVVDGDPEGSSAPVVEAFRPRVPTLPVRYVSSAPGLTRQRNLALDLVEGDVVVFADDDVTFDPGAFAALAGAYRDPSVVGATGRIDEPADTRVGNPSSALRRVLLAGGPEGSFTTFGYPRYLTHVDRPRDVEYMPGCLMSARTDVARRVRFDENLPGYGLAEDEDFSYRVSRLGRIRYVPGAVVRHRKEGFGSRDDRAFGRMVVVNRAYLFRKNFPRTLRARARFGLLVVMLLAHRLVNRDWPGARGLMEGAAAAWRAPR